MVAARTEKPGKKRSRRTVCGRLKLAAVAAEAEAAAASAVVESMFVVVADVARISRRCIRGEW